MLQWPRIPIVQAPLAGGPSTPELAAAVSNSGALGFVAAGYKTPAAMNEDIAATRALTSESFGVNVFAVTPSVVSSSALDDYASSVRDSTSYIGVEPGSPRTDDDHFEEKCSALLADPVPIVSFTFGFPSRELVDRMHGAGSHVWVTVTDVEEARTAARSGADALVVQGVEAGGHRATFEDSDDGDYGVLALLQLVSAGVDLPLIASGGIMTGGGIAAVLAAGAIAAQLGTAFMRCPEAGTATVHRDAIAGSGRTALTRAFTGRTARAIVNRFLTEHTGEAPAAYPAVHHLTAPVRARARGTGDPEVLNLWAGQAHELARDLPAGELVQRLDEEARAAVGALGRRMTNARSDAGQRRAG
jgi:nitronate monooxygenase